MRVIRERGHRWEKLDPGADNQDNETSGDKRLNTRHQGQVTTKIKQEVRTTTKWRKHIHSNELNIRELAQEDQTGDTEEAMTQLYEEL